MGGQQAHPMHGSRTAPCTTPKGTHTHTTTWLLQSAQHDRARWQVVGAETSCRTLLHTTSSRFCCSRIIAS